MTSEHDDGMSDRVAAAARHLQADVPVRPEWRAALLARIEADSRRDHGRGWIIRPPVAIAAGLLLVALGAVLGRFLPTASTDRQAAASVSKDSSVVRFVFVAPRAARVAVVGDFNQWNPAMTPLRRLSDGTWIADVPLAAGRYAYAFVVDGKLEADPHAPRAADGDFGVPNSIVMVRGS
jgi:hypothetical protein